MMAPLTGTIDREVSVSTLLARARDEARLDDFGDEEFHEALIRLVDSMNKDVELSEIGAAAFESEVHRILINRLRFADDLKRHPEILSENVENPIVILGMPRTGTTKLQRMLAADPDSHQLPYWRIFNPAPFPSTSAGTTDPRVESCRRALNMVNQLVPGLGQAHPVSAGDTDEDAMLQLYTFKSLPTYLTHPAHDYFDWLSSQSLRGTYRYTKQILQYLQWQDGGKRDRPWILKSPVHIGSIELILECFPKATLVFTHRNLHEVIPSWLHVNEMLWRVKTDAIDLESLGRMNLELWSNEMRKHIQYRESMGSRLDILDVQYEQIKDELLDVIRDIYRKADRELTPRREQMMLEWERAHPQHYAGRHTYSLSDYGVTQRDIDIAFMDYKQKFNQ